MSKTNSSAIVVQGPPTPAFAALCEWTNLQQAFARAAAGKRTRPGVAAFEHQMADHLLELGDELRSGAYLPQGYVHFTIHEPKRRRISAAAFRDRVLHHALCQVIEPRFERVFIPDSYANRVGKGTHRAVARLRAFAGRYRYVLRADIRQHFASIDHALLLHALRSHVPEADLMQLITAIVAGGEDALRDEVAPVFFPGDDLLSTCRPRGLPIGNLTSQFWSNCYMHGFDLFIKRELGCQAYLRYVDDFALFSDNKDELWSWKAALLDRLVRLRLTVHERGTQVVPTATGVPWLGFVVYPDHTRVKARRVRHGTRRLGAQYAAWRAGAISFAEFDASVQGWINHVAYADSWGLRKHVLAAFELQPGNQPAYTGRRR